MLSLRTFTVMLLLILSPLSAIAGVLPERQSWEFMQSVGGISIGAPYREDATWRLPVSCDVSGLQKITVKPTLLNSALAAAETDVKVDGNAIYVTVVTFMRSHNRSARCGPAELGKLSSGNYSVYYRHPDGTPHALGTISIKQ